MFQKMEWREAFGCMFCPDDVQDGDEFVIVGMCEEDPAHIACYHKLCDEAKIPMEDRRETMIFVVNPDMKDPEYVICTDCNVVHVDGEPHDCPFYPF